MAYACVCHVCVRRWHGETSWIHREVKPQRVRKWKTYDTCGWDDRKRHQLWLFVGSKLLCLRLLWRLTFSYQIKTVRPRDKQGSCSLYNSTSAPQIRSYHPFTYSGFAVKLPLFDWRYVTPTDIVLTMCQYGVSSNIFCFVLSTLYYLLCIIYFDITYTGSAPDNFENMNCIISNQLKTLANNQKAGKS